MVSNQRRSTPFLLSSSLILLATTLPALEEVPVGPRALGMGGVGVACAEDTDAQFYNPATFGFFSYGTPERQDETLTGRFPRGEGADNNDLARKNWGWRVVDLTAGARINGDLATYVDQVLKVDADKIKNLGANPVQDAQTIKDLAKVAESISTINPDVDSVSVDVNAGSALRIGHFGIGGRLFTQATLKVGTLDKDHLGISLPANTNLGSRINGISQPGFNPAVPYTPKVFTTTQRDQLAQNILISAQKIDAAFSLTNATEAANRLDFAASQAGIPAAAVAGVLDSLNKVAEQTLSSNTFTFGNNTTTVRASAVAVGEIPISYGYAFNDHFAVGGNAKLIVGRVYGTEVQIFNTSTTDSVKDILTDSKEAYEQTITGALDLSIMGRMDFLQAGITGRNLNAPKLKGPTVNGVKFDDVTLDPQVDIGVAVIPFYQWYAGFTLAADYQVLRSKTTLPGYDTQRAGVGGELKLLSTLDLRAGISKNLASADAAVMYHAGIGLNLWLARIDLAGSMANEKVIYDGDEYPKEARASFALTSDW